MLLGYNTNGFAHHRLEDALAILADLGYQSVALTLDNNALNPYEPDLLGRTAEVRRRLHQLKLRCVIETGARFLLDPRRKHQPTLLSSDASERERRLDFLQLSLSVASELGADCLSFWSGASLSGEADALLWPRLVEGCQALCRDSERYQVPLAFEPEPGMFVDTMDKFARLHAEVASPHFGLTLDIGHLHCQGEIPMAPHIERWREQLRNVHLEDMKAGVHDHLMFGAGDIDFPPVLAALEDAGYTGGLHVELSRHSHDAVNAARAALAFLRKSWGKHSFLP